MEQQRIFQLLERYYRQQLSPEERSELLSAFDSDETALQEALAVLMAREAVTQMDMEDVDLQASISQITALDKPERRPRIFSVRRMWQAAAVVLLLSAGGWWFTHREGGVRLALATDYAPGREGAILTLADGSQVVLDSIGNGTVASQQGAVVVMQNNRLAYKLTGENNGNVAYNTINTPKGRQFQVDLPDGTRVWLNAASSIQYPTVFNGARRHVMVTGEVYFEVARNVQQPFHVTANKSTEIEVLGTSFNVNAYADEPAIHTTLIQGGVRVSGGSSSVVLRPGQQATVGQSRKIVVSEADISMATAWKDGLFAFDKADVPTVMRQLSRWYNVEVEYAGAIPAHTFSGKIGKSLQLSQVLKLLTKTRIKYRIEGGQKIIILPDEQ